MFRRLCICLALLSLPLAAAQDPTAAPTTTSTPTSAPTTTPTPDVAIDTNVTPCAGTANCPCPDVLLNVPKLSVGEIDLQVQNLTARVNLDVNAANLVTIKAGVDVNIDQVSLNIKDVEAQLRLEVRLGNIVKIVNRTLSSLDLNPLVNRVLDSVDNLVSSLTNVLSDFVNDVGQRIVQTIDNAGRIVNSLISSTGQIASQSVLGTVSNLLSLTSTTVNAAGDTVKRFTSSTGAIVDLTTRLVNGVESIVSVNVIQRGVGGIVPNTVVPTSAPTTTTTTTTTTAAP